MLSQISLYKVFKIPRYLGTWSIDTWSIDTHRYLAHRYPKITGPKIPGTQKNMPGQKCPDIYVDKCPDIYVVDIHVWTNMYGHMGRRNGWFVTTDNHSSITKSQIHTHVRMLVPEMVKTSPIWSDVGGGLVKNPPQTHFFKKTHKTHFQKQIRPNSRKKKNCGNSPQLPSEGPGPAPAQD